MTLLGFRYVADLPPSPHAPGLREPFRARQPWEIEAAKRKRKEEEIDEDDEDEEEGIGSETWRDMYGIDEMGNDLYP
jgi:hypothetical protein